MTKPSKSGQTIVLKGATLLSHGNSRGGNVRVFEATVTVDGTDYPVIVPMCFTGRKPVQSARSGQPWEEEASLWTFRSKKPGAVSLLNPDGSMAGRLLQVRLSKYHPELDTRPKAGATVPDAADDLGDLFG